MRLYDGADRLFYYAVSHMEPDPAGPCLQQILDRPEQAGIVTTAL